MWKASKQRTVFAGLARWCALLFVPYLLAACNGVPVIESTSAPAPGVAISVATPIPEKNVTPLTGARKPAPSKGAPPTGAVGSANAPAVVPPMAVPTFTPIVMGGTPRGESAAEKTRQPPAGSGLQLGNSSFSIPYVMVKDHSTPVDLLIDPSKSPAEVKKALEDLLMSNAHEAARARGIALTAEELATSNTKVIAQRILIGERMTAEIIAADGEFEVTPKGPQLLTYRPGLPLHWRWMVTPKKESPVGMPVQLKVTADPGKGPSVVVINRTVIVRAEPVPPVPWYQQLDRWIQAVMGSSIFLALLALWKWLATEKDGMPRWKATWHRLRPSRPVQGSSWFGHRS